MGLPGLSFGYPAGNPTLEMLAGQAAPTGWLATELATKSPTSAVV
jgi:hypothetical protein